MISRSYRGNKQRKDLKVCAMKKRKDLKVRARKKYKKRRQFLPRKPFKSQRNPRTREYAHVHHHQQQAIKSKQRCKSLLGVGIEGYQS